MELESTNAAKLDSERRGEEQKKRFLKYEKASHKSAFSSVILR